MPITTDPEFEDRLAQLSRLYRAERTLWQRLDAADKEEIARWTIAGGKIMEKLTEVLGDIEEYSGCMELRLIWDQLKAQREAQSAGQEND